MFRIGETKLDPDGITQYLEALGAYEWMKERHWSTPPPQGEFDPASTLIEVAGRTCYKSFGLGLNPNITKIHDDPADYIANALRKGDGSILEHASVTFAFVDVSRVFTPQLVRHRAGTAISQESLRYVRPRELRMTLVPGSELARLTALQDLTFELEALEAHYLKHAESQVTENLSFYEKKAWTSALRRMLPDGIATNIVWTANHRALRWILETRTSPSAEVEMRYVFDKVGRILRSDYPLLYQDFETSPHEDGVGAQWIPRLRSKV